PGDYQDVWPAVRPEEGFTVDTEENEMRGRGTEERKRVRFDRILIRSPSARPVAARLVGTKSIRGSKPKLYPSDHFGVFARLDLTKSRS
ncbi:MAG TPA: hypothetical protein VLA09_03865, partial [Longimicrobiales bacterium]|nr:hypothetical protein [Longimicrobiales bacterium]